MKNAAIPSLRVDPALRKTFIERGLASREQARHSGEYYSAESVMQELDAMLAQAQATSCVSGCVASGNGNDTGNQASKGR